MRKVVLERDQAKLIEIDEAHRQAHAHLDEELVGHFVGLKRILANDVLLDLAGYQSNEVIWLVAEDKLLNTRPVQLTLNILQGFW